MDTLKGKQIMVWTFMGNARMYEALRDYGDRISQIGLCVVGAILSSVTNKKNKDNNK